MHLPDLTRPRPELRTRFTEHSILFLSVLKWVTLAAFIGLLAGAGSSFFLVSLKWSIDWSHHYEYYFLALPAAMFISAAISKYFAPNARGDGTERVIAAVLTSSGRISPAVVPVTFAATLATVAAGGSVGKEGPSAQIGGGLASLFADIFRFNDEDRRKLVICGISAGFSAVFGTPIAGSILAVEIFFAGSIMYEVLLPSFVAGIVGYHVATLFGVTYFHAPLAMVPVFSESFFLKTVLEGVFIGLCAALFIETIDWGKNLANRINVWPPLKGAIGGGILVLLAFIFSTKYLGLGLDTIEGSLQGAHVPWYAFLAKMGFTSVTLAFGGCGGIVTPIFFVGATAGAAFATLFALDTATFSAIGMVSLLAGATNTPIASSIMAVEMFGSALGPYACIACVISFLMTGHRSVLSTQVFSVRKSSSFEVELGKTAEETTATYKPKQKLPWQRGTGESDNDPDAD